MTCLTGAVQSLPAQQKILIPIAGSKQPHNADLTVTVALQDGNQNFTGKVRIEFTGGHAQADIVIVNVTLKSLTFTKPGGNWPIGDAKAILLDETELNTLHEVAFKFVDTSGGDPGGGTIE